MHSGQFQSSFGHTNTYMVSANLIITELNRSYRTTTNIVVPITVLVLIRFCSRICSKDTHTHTPNTQHPLSFFIIILYYFQVLESTLFWHSKKQKQKASMDGSIPQEEDFNTYTHTQSHNLQYKYNLKVEGGNFSYGLFDWCMREVVVMESVIPTQPNS